MSAAAAARVDDRFGHSSALSGALIGLAVGAVVGAFIIGTGGLGAIAVGAAIATTGGVGLMGQAIGKTVPGPDTGQLKVGSPTVNVNRKPATMTVMASGLCSHHAGPRLVATGSSTVRVHGQPMARVGEQMDCSATIRSGSPDVRVGGPSEQVVEMEPEVPAWLNTTMTAMAIGGGIIATAGVAATYGIGAAVGSTIAGGAGGWAGGKGGRAAAEAMGFGETGQAIGEAIGSTVGGGLAGRAGFQRGNAAAVPYRRQVAQDFYAKQGWPQGKIDSHMAGIDFNRPVSVTTIPAGRQLSQWQVPGGPKGNYFAPSRETPGRLGISPVGHDPAVGAVSKVQTPYVSSRSTPALRSTAARVDDTWSNPYSTAATPGGGRQYFVPDASAFDP